MQKTSSMIARLTFPLLLVFNIISLLIITRNQFWNTPFSNSSLTLTTCPTNFYIFQELMMNIRAIQTCKALKMWCIVTFTWFPSCLFLKKKVLCCSGVQSSFVKPCIIFKLFKTPYFSYCCESIDLLHCI